MTWDAYKGHVDGKVGTKGLPSQSAGSFKKPPATPLSPDAKMTVVPRAPSWAYISQIELQIMDKVTQLLEKAALTEHNHPLHRPQRTYSLS